MIVFKDLLTSPGGVTDYVASTKKFAQVHAKNDIDAEHHLAACMGGLGVTVKPETIR